MLHLRDFCYGNHLRAEVESWQQTHDPKIKESKLIWTNQVHAPHPVGFYPVRSARKCRIIAFKPMKLKWLATLFSQVATHL
jgi:hypothetical protein